MAQSTNQLLAVPDSNITNGQTIAATLGRTKLNRRSRVTWISSRHLCINHQRWMHRAICVFRKPFELAKPASHVVGPDPLRFPQLLEVIAIAPELINLGLLHGSANLITRRPKPRSHCSSGARDWHDWSPNNVRDVSRPSQPGRWHNGGSRCQKDDKKKSTTSSTFHDSATGEPLTGRPRRIP